MSPIHAADPIASRDNTPAWPYGQGTCHVAIRLETTVVQAGTSDLSPIFAGFSKCHAPGEVACRPQSGNCEEALSRVLGQSQAQRWSQTQTPGSSSRPRSHSLQSTTPGRPGPRFTNLPSSITLTDLELDTALGIGQPLIAGQGACSFLETATNVLLIGPPGFGRTDIATGLCRAAAQTSHPNHLASAGELAAIERK